jgi:hypothetical protein
MQRTVAAEVKRLAEIGFVVLHRGKKLKGKKTFCWRWLTSHGCVSRKKGSTRGGSTEMHVASLVKWLHCFRDVILRTDPSDTFAEGNVEFQGTRKLSASLLTQKLAQDTGRATKKTVPLSAFGRYIPCRRFNVDQVPFNLDGNPLRSYIAHC